MRRAVRLVLMFVIAAVVIASVDDRVRDWLTGADQPDASEPASADYLAIGAARITERPPFDPRTVADRQVTFSLSLKGPPVCSLPRPSPIYLFLIDADRSGRTGAVKHPFSEIGVDAEILIRCHPETLRLVSTFGDVIVQPAPDSEGLYGVEMTTTLRGLPSSDFFWIAVAQEGRRYERLPEAGRVGAWRSLELWRRY